MVSFVSTFSAQAGGSYMCQYIMLLTLVEMGSSSVSLRRTATKSNVRHLSYVSMQVSSD
jgi:hypothetical protein